ncbi:MAG TPA: enoyl-CoA hydratase [Myxococcales bacterium]|nr:enoyl-CoA hydratase [Myxococcales bacterium]HIL02333.1 enoyl-CoA hydratase [Myxococcales bacterium]
MSSNPVLIDEPIPGVRRITLNRPEKRNALNHDMRGGILNGLEEADNDPSVRVMIVRGAGKCFSSGYELGPGNDGQDYPWYTPGGDGHWPRHVTQGWMRIWEFAKPVIAQVHGYCLAGGSELATCCDLVYMSDDAEMGYPAVRFGVPDNHFHAWFVGMRKAMEMMITGDSLTAKECVELGWANASVPPDELEAKVLEVAKRVISVPADLVQLNKRVVHRQMEIMGLHTGIRAGAELCALGTHQKSMHEFMARTKEQGLKAALQDRDEPFGDYRTKEDE